MRNSLILLLFLIPVMAAEAQKSSLGSWNIMNIKYSVNEKWSLFGEAQLRSLNFYDDYHYYEYKGGFDYKLHKDVKVSLGAGSYQTYREGGDFVKPKANDEFRIWPQIVISQKINKIKIEQRYRTELRYTSSGYRNRLRFRVGVSYTFGKETNRFKPFQVSASNELFFTNKEPYFERNRFLFAFNYKPSKITTVQIGYLYQFDYKINDETGRQFLQIGYFVEFGRNNKSRNEADMDLKDN